MRRHPDLTQIDGTIGKLFSDNRDKLLNVPKSTDEILNAVKTIFQENHINTPKSRLIEYKLAMMHYNQALQYIQNIIFAAANMNV